MDAEIARLRELLAKATPGEWSWDDWVPLVAGNRSRFLGSRLVGPGRGFRPAGAILRHEAGTWEMCDEDAELIVAMHGALPALLDRLDAAERRVAEMEGAIGRHRLQRSLRIKDNEHA
jgi:hypothetical protein